ncbi:EAL domain-containing protein [Shewanella sp. MEBiC00475]|uniref:EAL domain-containing protein n=1 Tax=Shewanella sp. MEBiC00475 TaxID=2575361 RepID=UPI0010C0A8FE|nr:EAL domain-containing protein [Shewanella sp. MEBiC00475]
MIRAVIYWFVCMGFYLLAAIPANAGDVVQRVFTARDGLANASIQDISFDHYGFVWLATQQGLYRVSNSKVRRIDKVGFDSVLDDEFITTVVNSGQDHLLVGSNTSLYLYSILNNHFSLLLKPKDNDVTNINNSIRVVATQRQLDGRLLILAYSGQVYYFDDVSQQLSLSASHSLDHQLPWRNALELHSSQYLFSTDHLLELHQADGAFIGAFPWTDKNGSIRELFQDKQQRIWMLTSKGLFRVDVENLRLQPVNNISYYVDQMEQDLDGNLWISSRAGLIFWNPSNDKFTIYHDELKQDANIDYIHDMAVDADGLLWVGGSGDGLAVIAEKPKFLIEEYSKAPPYQLDNEMVWSIYSEGDQLWMGTDGGLSVVDTQHQTSTMITPPGFELNDSIYRIESLDKDHIVLASSSGLYVVNKITNASSNFADWSGGKESLKDKVVIGIYHDDFYRDVIWFGTNHGLYYWKEGNSELQLQELSNGEQSLTNTLYKAILRDDADRLWLSGSKHFGYLTAAGEYVSKLEVFSDFTNLPTMNSFMQVAPDIMWLGTSQHGIYQFNTKTDDIISLDQQWKINCKVVFFLQDTITDHIVGCATAIIKVNKKSGKVSSFSHQDGLISDEFNESAKFYDPNKGFFIGTPDGAMLINLDELASRTISDKVILESVSVFYENNTAVYLIPSELTQVEPGASLISFQIALLDYLDDKPMAIQYRLVKDDNAAGNYVLLEGQSQINITGLSAGAYVLELLYKRNGIWSSEPFQYPFAVKQLWWRTQQFEVALILIILLIVSIILLFRQRQVHRFKQINHALVESDERLHQALKGSDSDLWEWHDSTQMLSLDNQSGVLGPEQNISVKLDDIPIHVDDIDRMQSVWKDLITGQEEMIDAEYRYRNQYDHQWHWLRIKGRAIKFDPSSGRVTHAAGMYTDISQQRELESEVNLLAQAFENTSEGMLILDDNKNIKISNAAANLILTSKRSDLAGKHFADLVFAAPEPFDMEDVFNKEHFWTGECEFNCIDGSRCPVWINVSTMLNANGTALHYVVVFSDITERKHNELHLRRLANSDTLTGLANRAMFSRRLGEAIETAKKHKETLALLFLDLDRFKHVNDSYGHSMGDALLVEAANRLQSCLSEKHLLCRFGGDEFVLLLRDANDVDTINHIATQLLKQIEMPFKLYGREFFISTSIGISIWSDDDQTPETLIKNADLAMYHAKEEGRGNFQYYSAERNAEALYHLRLEADLHRAVQCNEFELYYQPQIDVQQQNRLVGVEALIRWQHPKDGMVNPDVFIGIAESCGLIVEIDRWVLTQACIDGAYWHQQYQSEIKVSVNVSAMHFRQTDFIDFLTATLHQTGMPAHCLSMEITEGVLMKEIDIASQHLLALKQLGIDVAIDDFGTGYSSLAYLRSFQVNVLKVDRSFLIHIDTNKADQAILSSIIELARNLSLEVIAEGVESEQQLNQVVQRGCHIIQGYYFAKPMPKSEIEHKIKQQMLIDKSRDV